MINRTAYVKPARKALMISLIVANLFMLIIGIITVLPNVGIGWSKTNTSREVEPGQEFADGKKGLNISTKDGEKSPYKWGDLSEDDGESEDLKNSKEDTGKNFTEGDKDLDSRPKEKLGDSDKDIDKGKESDKDKEGEGNSGKEAKGLKDKGAKDKKASYSTLDRPELEEFFWYTVDLADKGIPAGASPINNPDPLNGGWKALIIYDPDNRFESNAVELLNIDFSAVKKDIILTLDWYLMFWGDDSGAYDETDMDDSIFMGKWENNGLWASGPGTIRLTQFYELGQKQYGIGTVDVPDGIPAYIALVRP